MPRRNINFASTVTASSTIAFVEAGGAIKVLLELVEFDIVIPNSMDVECGLNVGELRIDMEERTF